MSLSVRLFFLGINVFAYLVGPVTLIWGWLRWSTRPKPRNIPSSLSLIGFVLASASALVGVASVVYAQIIHGFSFYDPRLMRILRWGVLSVSQWFSLRTQRHLASECTPMARPTLCPRYARILDGVAESQ